MTLVGQRSFSDLGTPLSEVPFCVLDLETTGVGPDRSEITEIGAVKFEGGLEVGRFQTLVNPGAPIPPQVTVITGITQAMVIDAPRIEEALPSFLEFLGESVIVGHNVSFDVSFLNAAAIRLGYGRLPHQSTDTLRLARRLVRKEVRNLRLSSLASHFHSPTTPNHRALDDAIATAHVFWCLLERAGSIGVTHLDDLLALPSIKGSRAIGKLDLTEHLPRRPGVYRFINASGAVIYIGKATNLRARVRSYFGGDTRRKVDDMLRELAAIEHQTTTCELEASVVEVRQITQHLPRYNRRSKPPRSLHWVRLTDEEYPRLQLGRISTTGRTSLGPFRSRRAAEQVMFALWDGSQIRRCGTPCRGDEFRGLGTSTCPCAGTDDDGYAAVVAEFERALATDPAVLFEGLARKMTTFARHQRFEEAADVRDRWDALKRSIEDVRAWTALQEAGIVIATDADGISALINRGHLHQTWRSTAQRPFLPEALPPQGRPGTMAEMEEARLIWRWLSAPGIRFDEITGALSLPVGRLPDPTSIQATEAPGGTSPSGRSSTVPSSVGIPRTSTSERNPPTRMGANPATTMTWVPTRSSAS